MDVPNQIGKSFLWQPQIVFDGLTFFFPVSELVPFSNNVFLVQDISKIHEFSLLTFFYR